MSLDWSFITGLISSLAIVAPVALWLARRIRSLSMFSDPRLAHFLDDWFGEPARPGFEGRPGFPERLTTVEKRLDAIGGDTEQLKENGGAHLADRLRRIEELLMRGGPDGGST